MTVWAQVIDDFEAGLDGAEHALRSGEWRDAPSVWAPPVEAGGLPSGHLAERIDALLQRAVRLDVKLQRERRRMLAKFEGDRVHRQAAEAYLQSESMADVPAPTFLP